MKSKMALLTEYFKDLADVYSRGDATEESFYSCLEKLFQQFAASTGRSEVHVTALPKKTEAGNPDFRVWNGHDRIIGYMEAKRPFAESLDYFEATEQLQRYLHTFPNLILTNFFEFRLYRNGQLLVSPVTAARPRVLQLGVVPPVEKGDELLDLLERFFSFSLPRVFTAESLAIELAKRTRFLRDVVADELREEQATEPGVLLGFYEAFQNYLIANLTLEDFADLYAQTITYGLFAARTRTRDGFNRRMAFDNIPRTIGILRDVFRFISLGDLPRQLEWIVDDISEVLAVADAGGILDRFYHEGKGSDPIVHFYETFLAVYDPEERERRGVYYTPEPVVSYIVRSLHRLLKKKFGRPDGLASEGVTLLDPAAGTMTFVARACQEAVREFADKYGTGGREEFIRQHILRNYYAFELMMAPYAVGHLKMSFFLEELGHRLGDDERFQFYLTNTLQMEELEQTHLPGMASLSQESHLAGEVKKQRPILVVLGNPPYSFKSHKTAFIGKLMEDYKKAVKGEKKYGTLEDDYIKFIRFAHWKLDQAGKGILGFITNNSYLSGVTHRGMRQEILKSFDEIYLLNLHGSSRIGEKTPEGGRDENVFDIQQGVAIALYVKLEKPLGKKRVYYADLWGLRDEKYKYLFDNDVETTQWEQLDVEEFEEKFSKTRWGRKYKSGFYFFIPKAGKLLLEFGNFWGIDEIFKVGGSGIITRRDSLAVAFNEDELQNRMLMFANLSLPDSIIQNAFKVGDTYEWNLRKAREMVKDERHADKIKEYHYRPWDFRYIYYSDSIVSRTCTKWMEHLLSENLVLVTTRVITDVEEKDSFVSSRIGDIHIISGQSYFFPLYLYSDTSKKSLFSDLEPGADRKSNLNRKVMAALQAAYGQKPTPEDIFHYIYAVLYAPTYREKYAAFLKTDFPRLPFTADFQRFQALAALGKRLVDLHLLRSEELDPPAARFQGKGDSRVARGLGQGLRYEPKEERVYVNKTQYFAPVPRELWEYQIGGYQVLEKWLKDRQGRPLALEEIKTYCRVVTAIQRTIALQEEIDALYPEAEARIVSIEG